MRRWLSLGRGWHRFSRNHLSVVGLVLVTIFVMVAILAPVIAPYPEHAGAFIDFAQRSKPPSARNWFGTDLVGRDVLSRIAFGYGVSLQLSVLVLAIAVPLGVIPGLIAGFGLREHNRGRAYWVLSESRW